MFAKQKRAALKYAGAFLVVGGLSWISLVGGTAPGDVDRMPSNGAPDFVDTTPAFNPWRDGLSEGAVDAAGIELNLDGNASALVASPF